MSELTSGKISVSVPGVHNFFKFAIEELLDYLSTSHTAHTTNEKFPSNNHKRIASFHKENAELQFANSDHFSLISVLLCQQIESSWEHLIFMLLESNPSPWQLKLFPQFFWKNRTGDELLYGLHSTWDSNTKDSVLKTPTLLKQELAEILSLSTTLTVMGAADFFYFAENLTPSLTNDLWEDFSPTFFFIPTFQIQIRRISKTWQCRISAHYLQKEKNLEKSTLKGKLLHNLNTIKSALDSLPHSTLSNSLHPRSASASPIENPISTISIPLPDEWKYLVSQVQKEMHSKEGQEATLHKVVLARQRVITYPHLINPFQILKNIFKSPDYSYLCYLSISREKTFISVTPERLFRLSNSTLYTEALAGTIPRSKSRALDRILGSQLLNSSKDLHEHQLVCQQIEQTLSQINPIDETLAPKGAEFLSQGTERAIRIIKLRKLQHLYHPYKKKLSSSTHNLFFMDLISKLHPTPAVGGLPLKNSWQWIMAEQDLFSRNGQPFARGLYAAPIGYSNQLQSEFAVGIRSVLIKGSQIFLFAGAGIVPKSDWEKEWNEIEEKLNNFQRFL